jgi:excisionase family DNA binding protein
MPKTLTSLLTVQEAANQLRLCPDSVYRVIWRGDLTAHRFAGAVRISQADLDAYIARGRGIRIRHHRKKEPVMS